MYCNISSMMNWTREIAYSPTCQKVWQSSLIQTTVKVSSYCLHFFLHYNLELCCSGMGILAVTTILTSDKSYTQKCIYISGISLAILIGYLTTSYLSNILTIPFILQLLIKGLGLLLQITIVFLLYYQLSCNFAKQPLEQEKRTTSSTPSPPSSPRTNPLYPPQHLSSNQHPKNYPQLPNNPLTVND